MKHRLFLAIDLPPVQSQLVFQLQQQLDKLGMPISWEPEEKLHMTLNFVGRLDNEQTVSLQRSVLSWVNSIPQFNLKLTFLESMYNRHEPSIIYLAPTGGIEQLKNLQTAITTNLTNLSIPQPIRFLPHVTIGKLKRTDPTLTKKFLDQISDQPAPQIPEFTVEAVVLYESFLSRSGSHYQRLRHYSLSRD